MHEAQRDVAEFHRVVVGIPDGEFPAIRRGQLRADLIMEEAVETAEASTGRRIEWRYVDDESGVGPDLVSAIDGICDLLYVTYGTALEYGFDVAPFFGEVHAANMRKTQAQVHAADMRKTVGPVRRGDGKILKPEGWVGPDIAGVLLERYGVIA